MESSMCGIPKRLIYPVKILCDPRLDGSIPRQAVKISQPHRSPNVFVYSLSTILKPRVICKRGTHEAEIIAVLGTICRADSSA